MVDYAIAWGDTHGQQAVSVVAKTNIGGLFVDETITDKEKWVLIPFVGTDPNGTTNVQSYSMYKKTCIIDEVNNDWVKNKGALHATQYHPTSVKG